MSEWQNVKLRDVSLLITKGTTPSTMGGGFQVSGINYIKSESLSYDGNIDQSKFVRVSAEVHEQLRRSQIKEQDILYSIAGINLGKCGLAKKDHLPANTNQAVAIIRIDPQKADPKFIHYYLRNPAFVQQVLNGSAQSAQPNVNLTDIGNFNFTVPNIHSQKAIAAILSALDDKIELNRRMNATLEAMARALFKSWFVDFDPVRAKSEGRHPFGMDAETAALFPSHLVPSALGDIPEGWSMEKLGEVSRITIGRTPPRKEQECFVDSPLGTTWLSIRDMADGSVYAFNSSEGLTTESIEQYRVPVVPTNTVIVSFKLTVGRVALTGKPMTTNEAIAHIRIDESPIKSSLYLYCFMKQYDFTQLASTSSIATAVNSESIRGMKILLPDEQVQNAFHNQVKDIFEKIRDNLLETEKLEKTRDYLLPKLISGDIRIPDAEKFVRKSA